MMNKNAKGDSTVCVIYTPESPVRRPLQFLHECLRDLRAARGLAWRLLIRNVSARYRQTLLGYFWALFPPLATTAIWVFLASQRVFAVNSPTGTSYLVFVLTGTMLWQTFVDAVQAPLRVTSESRSMLSKINFPREALPMAAVGEVLFNLAIRIAVLAIFFLFLGVSLPPTAWLTPFGMAAIILFGTFVGMIIVPIGMLYQDVSQSLLIVTQVWMFCTPVVYEPPTSGAAALLNWVNPVSPLLVATRDWMLVGASPSSAACLALTAISFVILCVSFLLYRIAMPVVIERIGS